MDEKNLSPTFLAMLEIIEVLRDTINNIDEVYNETTKEMVTVWNKLKN
jgi:hypothetical protein